MPRKLGKHWLVIHAIYTNDFLHPAMKGYSSRLSKTFQKSLKVKTGSVRYLGYQIRVDEKRLTVELKY